VSGVRYGMYVESSTPNGLVRLLVTPNNVPYYSSAVTIRVGEFECDEDVKMYGPVYKTLEKPPPPVFFIKHLITVDAIFLFCYCVIIVL